MVKLVSNLQSLWSYFISGNVCFCVNWRVVNHNESHPRHRRAKRRQFCWAPWFDILDIPRVRRPRYDWDETQGTNTCVVGRPIDYKVCLLWAKYLNTSRTICTETCGLDIIPPPPPPPPPPWHHDWLRHSMQLRYFFISDWYWDAYKPLYALFWKNTDQRYVGIAIACYGICIWCFFVTIL